MAEIANIDKKNQLSPSEDYNFLRREGIRLIEGLSGKIWTDYNTHDPGITLLEALCYAITDLGYRTSFDIKDILASKEGGVASWQKVFYTARQILPCNPVTINDYRKIIIDVGGVRNAWVEMSDEYEILMYIEADEEEETSLAKNYKLSYDSERGGEVLRLRGLYQIFVEYENDILQNNLEEEVAKRIKDRLHSHRNLCEDFISVSSIEYEPFVIDAEIQVSEGTDIEKINAHIYDAIHDFLSPPITFYSLDQMLEKGISVEEIFEGPLLKHGFILTKELDESERYNPIHLSDLVRIVSSIEGVIAIKKLTFPNETSSPFSDLTEWLNNLKYSQKAPKLDLDNSSITFIRSGDRHRDSSQRRPNKERVKSIYSFLQSAKFKKRQRGTADDLRVPEGEFMDISEYYPFQKTLPAAYGMSEGYLDISVNEISIKNAIDDILAERVGYKLRDIINVLLVVKPNDPLINEVVNNLLRLHADSSHIERSINLLVSDESNDALIKQTIERLGLNDNTQQLMGSSAEIVQDLFEKHNSFRIAAPGKAKLLQELAFRLLKKPLSDLRDERDLITVRNEYKKIMLRQLDERKKLTLQLRGFLMVFEQILTDYLSQLSRTKDLFSFDPEVRQTFFPQSLEGIEDIEALFIDYKKYTETKSENRDVEEKYIEQKNLILDHIVGRFSEDLSKYSFFLHSFLGHKAGKEFIKNKLAFLSDYIQISNYRGKGFDLNTTENVWESDNVAGLKKRICRLLGIRDYSRRFIASDNIFIEKLEVDENIARYVVILKDPDNPENILLRSNEYEFEGEAYEILNYILTAGIDEHMYEREGRKDRWNYALKRFTQEADFEIVAEMQFRHREAFEKGFQKTLHTLKEFSEEENFHLVEHILLRPKVPPRERVSKKNSSRSINADSVDLLSVTASNFNDTAKSSQVGTAYKFKITNINDSGRKERVVWRLALLRENNTDALDIHEDFIFYKHLTRRIEQIRQFASDSSNYFISENADGYLTFTINDVNRQLAVSRKNYRTKEDIDTEINNLVSFFSFDRAAIFDKADNFNSISFLADPYSFHISIVVPDWPAKFRNPTFKHLFEKTIYMETPAHIYPHVYWLDHRQMRQFEEAYRLWIEELASSEIPDTDIVNNLVLRINALRK